MLRLILMLIRLAAPLPTAFDQQRAIQAGPYQPKHPMQIAGIVVVTCLLLNVAFYFLSGLYFTDRAAIYGAESPEHVTNVREAFAAFSGSVGMASIVAAFAPRVIGHSIALLAGGASLCAGWAALAAGMPNVLGVALIVFGLVLPALALRSLAYSRAAWAFLVSMSAVYATVLMLGAPKVRGLFGIGLWTALIIPGILTVGTIALVMVRNEYRDG